jgi:hypothetical protein
MHAHAQFGSRAASRASFGSRAASRASTWGARRCTDRARARRLGLWLSLALFGAACSNGNGNGGNGYVGETTFGSAPPGINLDAAFEGNAEEGLAPNADSNLVRLRVFHGVLNLPGTRFCHDPDYRVDDPHTVADERDPGAAPAQLLLASELDGGTLPLGVAEGYFKLDAQLSGAILVQRAPIVSDAGADGGLPTNLLPDAGRDAGVPASDAAVVDAAVDPCDPASLEAVVPFPLSPEWLQPPRPVSDAGVDLSLDASAMDGGPSGLAPVAPARRGFVTTLSGDAPLTLFGSGRSLDPKEIAARRSAARDAYLVQNPGAFADAEAAGRAHVAWLESTLGPRFFLSRGVTPVRNLVALSLVHLIPDVVPSLDAGVPRTPSDASGALHLCIRVGTNEFDLPDAGAERIEFRNSVALSPMDPKPATYRFRLFVEADFVRTQASCGVTSLKPVAERVVPAGELVGGHSYTLVAWGARSASELCTYPGDNVVRPGCARPANTLNADILILENELTVPAP